jgi:hypothetical protein
MAETPQMAQTRRWWGPGAEALGPLGSPDATSIYAVRMSENNIDQKLSLSVPRSVGSLAPNQMKSVGQPFPGMPHSAGTGPIDRDRPGAVSENSEDEPDGPVDLSCLGGVKAAGEAAQPTGVDRAHLVDEYAGPGSIHFDLRPEDRRLRAAGSRGDDQRGKQDSVTLDRNCVPGAALLVPGGVLAGA